MSYLNINFPVDRIDHNMTKNLSCVFCSHTIYKLLYRINYKSDHYIGNILYCSACNLVFVGITSMTEFTSKPSIILSLQSGEGSQGYHRCPCSINRYLLQVPFYRRTNPFTKKRSKNYLFQLRFCGNCKKLSVVKNVFQATGPLMIDLPS